MGDLYRPNWLARPLLCCLQKPSGIVKSASFFNGEGATENTFTVRGNPDAWRDHVGALCVGNSRLAFAVAMAFAGPLLNQAGMSSGGFHYRGGSGRGKSTAQYLASSVYGGRVFKRSWRSTDNALEGVSNA